MSTINDSDYIETNVREFFEKMVHSTVEAHPEEVEQYMIKYLEELLNVDKEKDNEEYKEYIKLKKELEKYKRKEKNEESIGLSSEDEDEKSESLDVENLKINKKKMKVRRGISAEVYGEINKKEDFVPQVYPKTEEQKNKIKSKCLENFMFNALDQKELNTVIDAFKEVRKQKGDKVIIEGEKGSELFLIEEGELECRKVINGEDKFLKKYVPGETFGELALLYNAPRAASISALTECLLWSLDRECFNCIVKDSAMKKRNKYEEIIKNVEILKSCDAFEIGQICDALKSENFNKGDYIIKEGETGDKFYILVEGEAQAKKIIKGVETTVLEYKSGDFFGELALLNDAPRAASIYAVTDCSTVSLERKAFKRLLGNLQDIMKKNSDNYVKVADEDK